MGCGPQFERAVVQNAVRIDQFGGAEGGQAAFAFATPRSGGLAPRTRAFDVAVREEAVLGRTVVLVRGLLFEQSLAVQVGEKSLGGFCMDLTAGLAEVVEAHPEAREGLLDGGVVAIDKLLGCDALFFGGQGDGHPVFVRAADVENLLAPQTQEAHIYVRGQVGPGQMSQVDLPVGVGQGAGDQRPLEFLVLTHAHATTYGNSA